MKKQTVKKLKSKFLTIIFYCLIGFSASLLLFLAFYWSLSLNSNIYSLVNNTKNEPIYLWSYVSLTLGTIILFGINIPLFIYRWRRYGFPQLKTQSGTGLGALVGIAASACPVCGSLLLSAIGITAGLAVFPLQGLELKALSFGLMALPIILTGRELRRFNLGGEFCPIPKDSSYESKDKPFLIALSVLILVLLAVAWNILKTDPMVYRNF